MNAFDFINMLLLEIHDFNTTFSVRDKTNKFQQWFNIDYTKVDHTKKQIRLGATIIDDDPQEKYLDTLGALKKWFLDNKIKKDYTIEFENTDSELFNKAEVKNGNTVVIS